MCRLEPALSWLKAELSHLRKLSQLTSAGSWLAELQQHYFPEVCKGSLNIWDNVVLLDGIVCNTPAVKKWFEQSEKVIQLCGLFRVNVGAPWSPLSGIRGRGRDLSLVTMVVWEIREIGVEWKCVGETVRVGNGEGKYESWEYGKVGDGRWVSLRLSWFWNEWINSAWRSERSVLWVWKGSVD